LLQGVPKERNQRFLLLGYLTALGAAILNGLMPSVSKPILQSINPLFFTAIVAFSPALVFTPLSIRSKENKTLKRRGYAIIAVMAIVANLVAPYLYFVGVKETTASNAVLLANSEMIFTILFAMMFFGERLSRKGKFALSILAIGVIAVVTNLEFSASIVNFSQPGNILIVAACLFWGLDNNVTSAITQRVNVARIIQLKALISGSGLLILASLFGAVSLSNPTAVVEVILFGLFVFSGSFFLSLETLRRLGAITTTIVFPINSVFGLFFAFALLGETITAVQIASVILILFGIYLLTRKGSVTRLGINLEQI
jgi:drug/metabolite transporter (DMT)-like permease